MNINEKMDKLFAKLYDDRSFDVLVIEMRPIIKIYALTQFKLANERRLITEMCINHKSNRKCCENQPIICDHKNKKKKIQTKTHTQKTKTIKYNDLFNRVIVAQDVISAAIYPIIIATVVITQMEISAGIAIVATIDVHHHQNPVHHRVTGMQRKVQRIMQKSVQSVNIFVSIWILSRYCFGKPISMCQQTF